MRSGLDKPEHDRHQAAGRGQRADDVQLLTGLAGHPALRNQPRHHDQRDRRDRQVDVKDQPPRGQVGEHPGQHRTGSATQPGEPAPHPERLDPLARIREQHNDQSQRGRCGQCLPRALHEPARNQHRRTGRGPARGRCRREEPDPGEEQPSAAEQVGQPPAEQQKAARHQHVAVNHPRQPGVRERQVMLDSWERHVDDRYVDDEHELDQAEHRERPPAPRIGLGAGIRRDDGRLAVYLNSHTWRCTAAPSAANRRDRVRFRGARDSVLRLRPCRSAAHARVFGGQLHPRVHTELGEHAAKTAIDGVR
jgi:hypothetical protein